MKKTTFLLSTLFISVLVLGGGIGSTSLVQAAEDTATAETSNQISNTIAFKDMYGRDLGSTTATGKNVGDVVNLSTIDRTEALKSYVFTVDHLNLKSNGSIQTVTALPEGFSRVYGVIRINDQTEWSQGAYYYVMGGEDNLEFPPHGINGSQDNYTGLPHGSEWKFYEVAAWANGEYYYRVDSHGDWVSARDATLISTTQITGFNSVQKPFTNTITTKNQIAYLTKQDGTNVKNRALAPNTPWYTDKVAIINGVVMYRVATNEWVKETDLQWR